MYRVSAPRTPVPLRPRKRKAAALGQGEADELALARKAKIMQFMNPQQNRSVTPSYVILVSRLDHKFTKFCLRYRVLDLIERMKAGKIGTNGTSGQPLDVKPPPAAPIPIPQAVPAQPPRTSATPVSAQSSAPDPQKLKALKKIESGDPTPTNAGTPMPIPTPAPLPTQLAPHLIRQLQPSPRPTSRSPHPAAGTGYIATSSEPPRPMASPAHPATTASPHVHALHPPPPTPQTQVHKQATQSHPQPHPQSPRPTQHPAPRCAPTRDAARAR